MSNLTISRRTPHKKRLVAAQLREMIQSLAPGDRLPSMTEMERLFGVANSTVDAALGDLSAEGVIVRRQGSGTFVTDGANGAAANRRKVSDLVAVLSHDEGNTYFGAYIRPLESSLRSCGYTPLLIFNADTRQSIEMAFQRWKAGEIGGFIHIGSVDVGRFVGMPGVVIGETPQCGQVSQAVVDNFGAGRRVGEHLWSLGHRRVAFVSVSNTGLVNAPRLAGLKSVWKEQGAEWDEDWHLELPSYISPQSEQFDPFRRSVEPFFAQKNAPTALFAVDDSVAVQMIRALEGMGKRVPEDISLVGFNDMGMLAAHVRPALTTVRMPVNALAALAAQAFHESMISPDAPARALRVPGELILRESTAPVSER